MLPRFLRPLGAAALLVLSQACIIYVTEEPKGCDDEWDEDCDDWDDWDDDRDDWGDERPDGPAECDGILAYYDMHAPELHAAAEECWGDDEPGGGDPWAEECDAILADAEAMLAPIGISVEELWWIMLEEGPEAAQEFLRAHGFELPEDHLWLIFECWEVFGGGSDGETDADGDGIPDDECEAVSLEEPWMGDCEELDRFFAALEECQDR